MVEGQRWKGACRDLWWGVGLGICLRGWEIERDEARGLVAQGRRNSRVDARFRENNNAEAQVTVTGGKLLKRAGRMAEQDHKILEVSRSVVAGKDRG